MLPYRFCFILYLRAISKYKSLGAYIRRSDLREGFLRYGFGGLIHGGDYFRNYTVIKVFTLRRVILEVKKSALIGWLFFGVLLDYYNPSSQGKWNGAMFEMPQPPSPILGYKCSQQIRSTKD